MSTAPYIGGIFMFAGNFAPRGFALCQGQLMSISQNTALFSILGTTYGGDGVQTFGLPDLRGRAAIGQGQGLGLPPFVLGELTGTPQTTLLTTNLPMHNHTVSAAESSNVTDPSNAFPANDPRTPSPIYNSTTDGTRLNAQAVTMAGGSQPVSTQNPILAINFIIATEGVYPSRN